MLDIEEFEQKRDSFAVWLDEGASKFADMEKLRKEFVRRFPPKQLINLPIEQYVVGKKNKTTFCYWLETRLRELGNIKGGTTADKKFGIYFGRTIQDSSVMYRFHPKYGADMNEAYSTIKQAIADLIAAGGKRDFQAIEANILSPMFKGKILSTYYPDVYLNVFSERYLKYYLIRLGFPVSESKKESTILLGQRLLDFKNKDVVIAQWSNTAFGFFLWNKYGNPENTAEADFNPDNDLTEDLPSFSQIKLAEIIGDPVNFMQETPSGSEEQAHRSIMSKRDYIKAALKNTITGNRGEEIVLELEKAALRKAGKQALAEKVVRESEKSDAYGYDIHSYMPDGRDKYIEVKATRLSYTPRPYFIISANEFNQGCALKEQYFICWVFSAASKQPQYKYSWFAHFES